MKHKHAPASHGHTSTARELLVRMRISSSLCVFLGYVKKGKQKLMKNVMMCYHHHEGMLSKSNLKRIKVTTNFKFIHSSGNFHNKKKL